MAAPVSKEIESGKRQTNFADITRHSQ